MNRMDTMTVRWVIIWAVLAGAFLGAEHTVRKIRQRRKDAAYLRWLEANWNDDAGVDIFGNKGEIG